MNLDITKNQNLQSLIDLLTAQRQLYNCAKRVRYPRLFVSILLAAISPFIVIIYPPYVTLIGVIGGIWVVVAYILKKFFENGYILKAAAIQEEFDVTLYNLPWNEILVGKKVPPEEINCAKRNYKGDTSSLNNWYGNLSGVPYPLDIILCQRSNLVWDWRLKEKFSYLIFLIIISYFIFTIVFASINDLKVTEYILSLFLPALSAYFFGIDEGSEHYRAAKKRKNLEKDIQSLIDEAIKNPSLIKTSQLRQIQDCIFDFRKGPLIPNWFYNMSRDRYEKDMRAALAKYKKEAVEKKLID